ncbi:phage holin family protein [Lachnospiraceae bacterium MD1]|uniref:Phage holin family protein n=1 Tax=Variimorphobacter saccharofermentans TaxID=2755051 RepID=A0A839JUS3_9FIRM|nr:phage holin family protein [Variimorphobacter saccharofermentans]MBB2181393.1 phage holin family protein [Variimorphobacter saccharofermentans]
MEILSRYIVVVVLAICLCLGYIIKHSISFIPNKYIPLIMAVTGVILNVWISGWTFTPEILLGGLASGLASTGSYEMIRNIFGNRQTGKVTDNDALNVSATEHH